MDTEIKERLIHVEDIAKNNSTRLNTLEKRQDDLDKLVSSVQILATKQETMETDVKEIKSDVKSLFRKPAKRWESIVDKVIWAVLAAVIAYVLANVGL